MAGLLSSLKASQSSRRADEASDLDVDVDFDTDMGMDGGEQDAFFSVPSRKDLGASAASLFGSDPSARASASSPLTLWTMVLA